MSQASSPALRANTALRQRRALRNVILSCVAVLLLGQLLIAALSLAALLRLGTDSAADRLSLIAGRTSGQIQAGLQLGKPLTQYFGLSLVFDRLREDIPELQAAAVVLDDGSVLASTGPEIPSNRLLRELRQGGPHASESAAEGLRLALPLAEPEGGRRGALVILVNEAGLPDGAALWDNLRFLAIVTLAAAVLMALTMKRLPLQRIAAAGWLRMAVPVLIMLAAQALYAAHTAQDFRGVWRAVIEQNARIIGEGLEKDLEKVLGYGIEMDRMRGVEQPMQRAIHAFPLLGGMRLLGADGRVLAQVGSMEAGPAMLSFPLEAAAKGPSLGSLQLHSDEGAMRAAVRARALDAATIALVAMVAAIELMLMLQVLMDRAFSSNIRPVAGHAGLVPEGSVEPGERGGGTPMAEQSGPDDPSRLGMVARPVMFAFLFAMALPLGFLPLYARRLLAPGLDDGLAAMLVALPTAAEMAAGLAMALLAGRLIDRRGWLVPAAWGMGLAVAGNLACAMAESLWTLSAARALAGLGYGLVWMALQGFVVNLGQARYRGRNMTTLVAGLFAGHMTGAAVGGMLASQVGHRPVFLIGALMVLAAALALRTLLWPYRGPRGARPVASSPALGGTSGARLKRLFNDKGYAALLLGSVVPFSIAQVGLLSYALPLYFDALGASSADVGRVIMLYGFCVIYIGPMVGRLMDGSRHWKQWIAAGGLVGAGGLLLLQWAPGLWGVTAAVFLLALASCLAGAAHTPYMLARDSVQAYGAAGATGVMRGADKFGQMLGPLMVGALFAGVGMSAALVWTGVMYLAGTLLFWRLAPKDGNVQRSGK